MSLPDFEKLGSFYLGREYDVDQRRRTDSLLLYDARDLVTHAVCVGMTGSGKTGLCLTLLEEAAIDAIPSIIIDPKGDLANLLLTFPQLRPEDFRPWINEDDARQKAIEPDAFAARQAEMWRNGLNEWGQDGARVQRLRDSADFSVYTPGSSAGLPVSILRSFDAPDPALIEEPEYFRERVSSTVSSLLGLVNIVADPLQDREHILLSTILAHAWERGQSLDMAGIIHAIQQPPVARVGVMELESFYPARERFGLAMALNNLVASPGFSRWSEGEPLDIGAMLHTQNGRPRVSIFSIAHLNDAERMFFVSLLLNQVLGWVRRQSGTSSLRALVYMDEIAGYFPPTANPPSKQPLLTLMKQARAFGVGVVLATQNPVDLDYKGLSNAGTWFIGRLQTERDKARVLDGLEGAMSTASARFDRARIDQMLSQLSSRVFLMNNVHDDGPVVFETRWALSYLRGPMTRQQIKALMDARRGGASPQPTAQPTTASADSPPAPPVASAPKPTPPPARPSAPTTSRPVLPPEIPQYFLPVRVRTPGRTMRYVPMVLGCAKVFYSDAKKNIDLDLNVTRLAAIRSGPVAVDWENAANVDFDEKGVAASAEETIEFASLPDEGSKPKSYDAWKKQLVEILYRTHRLELMHSPSLDVLSQYREDERDFRARLQQSAREERDAQVEKLRQKYAPRLATLQDRYRRAEQAVEVQREQARAAKLDSAMSIGSAILAAFTGRKTSAASTGRRAATAARGVGRSSKESGDVRHAEENVEALRKQLLALDEEFQAEAKDIAVEWSASAEELEPLTIKPKKTNISVRTVMLVWAPHEIDAQGIAGPAW